ncbi:MAG: hypothetical protein WCI81_01165 [Chlorobiaceae bacterium]
MNERFFLKLLLTLFSGLVAAELLVVVLFGFRLELMLFCFIMAVALTGILLVVRLLLQQPPEMDSVSIRREREKRTDIMRDRLREYSVDEEFLGGGAVKGAKENSVASPITTAQKKRNYSAGEPAVSLEEAIRVHAEMYGGLGPLLQMMEKIDEASFCRLVKKAGLGELSREEVMCRITVMIEASSSSIRDTKGVDGGEQPSVLEEHSMDRESFDEYIRRCMTGAADDSKDADGFSVELDSEALSRGAGVPPADFSHDPTSVISSLKRAGAQS